TRRDLRQSDRIDIDRLSRKNRKLFLPISKTSRHNRPPSQFPPQGELQRRPSRPLTPPNRSQQPHWLPPNGRGKHANKHHSGTNAPAQSAYPSKQQHPQVPPQIGSDHARKRRSMKHG